MSVAVGEEVMSLYERGNVPAGGDARKRGWWLLRSSNLGKADSTLLKAKQ